MALVATAAFFAVRSNEPFIVTESTVTLTGDGSAVATAATRFAHLGPKGRAALRVDFVPTIDSSTGGETVTAFWGGTDTATDEVLVTFTTSAAIANSETVKGKLFCTFLPKAPDDGRQEPVGYTAPSNANF